MSKASTFLALPLLMALCAAVAGKVAADEVVVEFSADTLQSSPQGGTVNGRIYVGKQGMRREHVQNRQQLVEIVNTAQQKAWVLFPAERTYIERKGAASGAPPRTSAPADPTNPCENAPDGVTCTRIGVELIDGREAEKWEIVSTHQGQTVHMEQWIDVKRKMPLRQTSPQGTAELKLLGNEAVNGRDTEKWELVQKNSQGQSYRTVQWYDPGLEMTIREEMPGGYSRELRNIAEGSQPISLFQLPQDYSPKQMHTGSEMQGQNQDQSYQTPRYEQ